MGNKHVLNTMTAAVFALTLADGLTNGAAAQQKLDLNRPAQKTVTVGSEMERGRQAVNNAGGTTVNPVLLASEIQRISALNEQRNTDTDAFQLGVALQAFTRLTIISRLDSPVVDTHNAAKLAASYYDLCQALQRKMVRNGDGPCEAQKRLLTNQQ
jgi:hypothetical protein